MHNNNFEVWTLIIAVWGAATGTLSLMYQWWSTHYRFREPLYISGNVNTKKRLLTFTIRNRDPQIDAYIEKIYQQRKRGWWSMHWYEFPINSILHKGTSVESPLIIKPRTEDTFTIQDDYFARAIERAKSSNAEPVYFLVKTGSGYTFRLKPYINNRPQPTSTP